VRDQELRPPLWIGHVVLETDRLAESAHFMRTNSDSRNRPARRLRFSSCAAERM
jgi:hypothetical protein